MRIHSLYVKLRRNWIYTRCIHSPCQLIILRYHSVGYPATVSSYLDPSLSITPERFREQVRLLARRFRIITCDDIRPLLSVWDNAKPAVAITFDDGYRDNYEVALPILREEDVTATFFVTTGPLTSGLGLWISELWRLVPRLAPGPLVFREPAPETMFQVPKGHFSIRRKLTQWLASLSVRERERALDQLAEFAGVARGEGLENSFLVPDQLRGMRAAGMTIGAHTRSHPNLDRLNAAHHMDEISRSRTDLEAILQEPVSHFAYPNPGGDCLVVPSAREAVTRAGFLTAVTSNPAPIDRTVDPLSLPRIGVYAGVQERQLFEILERETS